MVAERLKAFGTSVFAEMTKLAVEHDAINLSQGFPDFEGPPEVVEAVIEALRSGQNQYARSMGLPALVEAVSRQRKQLYGLEYDPMSEVLVFSGATEGISSSMLGMLNPGDEVILFEPVYDSYPAVVALAGAVPRYLTLRFPDFALDLDALKKLFNSKTRLLVLNTPHNPTGKVFTRAELQAIAELCIQHDVIVLADEVYEHLSYDGVPHLPMASIPGMRERTLALSSTGKTYNFTGWKIGWGTGPKHLVAAAQSAHQFATFASATPIQRGVATALDRFGADYYRQMRAEYQARRDLLSDALARVGFQVARPGGTYFVMADFSALDSGDDVSFAKRITRELRVAAIPPTSFYPATPSEGRKLLRFAFCKRMETLQVAAQRLEALTRA